MKNAVLLLLILFITLPAQAQEETGSSEEIYADPVPLTNIPLIPETSKFYEAPNEENIFGLFPNSRRNLNTYLASQQYAEPLTDAEIAASKAGDGIIEEPLVLTPRVGIDLAE